MVLGRRIQRHQICKYRHQPFGCCQIQRRSRTKGRIGRRLFPTCLSLLQTDTPVRRRPLSGSGNHRTEIGFLYVRPLEYFGTMQKRHGVCLPMGTGSTTARTCQQGRVRCLAYEIVHGHRRFRPRYYGRQRNRRTSSVDDRTLHRESNKTQHQPDA